MRLSDKVVGELFQKAIDAINVLDVRAEIRNDAYPYTQAVWLYGKMQFTLVLFNELCRQNEKALNEYERTRDADTLTDGERVRGD